MPSAVTYPPRKSSSDGGRVTVVEISCVEGFLRGQVALFCRAPYTTHGRRCHTCEAGTGDTAESRGSIVRPGFCGAIKRGALARDQLHYREIRVRSTPSPPRKHRVGSRSAPQGVSRELSRNRAPGERGASSGVAYSPPPALAIVDRSIVAAL